MKSYRDLDVFKKAIELSIEVHIESLKLPQYELYEQGSQLRRSSKSIKDNLVEGYGRRRYKTDFIKFLVYAQASCDESLNQLERIFSLYQGEKWKYFIQEYNSLRKQIDMFIDYVEKFWLSSR